MASSFPILFGAPSFGDEDRDQWIRVLQLFLADPFQPHAVNVGGETQVQYGWTIPAGAISGGVASNPVPPNAFGIPQLLVSDTLITFNDGDILTLADRPGFMFLWVSYQYNDNINVTLWLGPSVDLQWSGDDSCGAGALYSVKDNPGTINVYKEAGSYIYSLQNATGINLRIGALHIGMGPLFSSGAYVGE